MPDCTIVGTVKNITNTGLARKGTRLSVVDTDAPGTAHETASKDFYVTDDGTLATTPEGGTPATVARGIRVKLSGTVKNFQNGAWVEIPDAATVDINDLVPERTPPSTSALTAHRNSVLDHVDVPDSYVGQAGKVLVVNDDEDALEFAEDAGGVTDHGLLTGLSDDDHPQYHTDARGDARYWPLSTDLATQAELNALTAAHEAQADALEALESDVDAKAPLTSPAFLGTPTAPTAPPGTSSTQLATTAFVIAVRDAILNGAPGSLDTLIELAAALGEDPNFATTITGLVGQKLAKASNLSDLTDVPQAKLNLSLMKSDVGLGNVDNTSDAAKPVSTAQVAALDAKVDAAFSAYTEKATPVDADTALINDSAASGAVKRLTWANLKAALKAYFDTVYQAALSFTGTGHVVRATGPTLTGVASASTVVVGGGSGAGALVGVAHLSAASVSTAGTSEETLGSYALPANSLNADGRTIRVTAWGKTVANANGKVAKIVFGGTTVTHFTRNLNGGTWRLTAIISRTGSNAQAAMGEWFSATSTGTWDDEKLTNSAPTETDSGAITITIKGTTPTAAGDLTLKFFLVEFLN